MRKISQVLSRFNKIRGLGSASLPITQQGQVYERKHHHAYWLNITGENAEQYQQALKALIEKYNVYWRDYLLDVNQFEDFSNELESIGIAFTNIDGWFYVKYSKEDCAKIREKVATEWWAQLPRTRYLPDGTCEHLAESIEYMRSIVIPEGTVDYVSESIRVAKAYVLEMLPKINYAAIYLDIPLEWDDYIFSKTLPQP